MHFLKIFQIINEFIEGDNKIMGNMCCALKKYQSFIGSKVKT